MANKIHNAYEPLYEYNKPLGIYDSLADTKVKQQLHAFPKTNVIETRGKSLDYIAYNLYGDVEYWVYLAEYNKIINPYEVPDKIFFIPINNLQVIINGTK